MKEETYSIYDAKARFSELLRKVRTNKRRIVITHHGKPVAELGPISQEMVALHHHLALMREQGVIITDNSGSLDEIEPIAKREGALQRFFDERD